MDKIEINKKFCEEYQLYDKFRKYICRKNSNVPYPEDKVYNFVNFIHWMYTSDNSVEFEIDDKEILQYYNEQN